MVCANPTLARLFRKVSRVLVCPRSANAVGEVLAKAAEREACLLVILHICSSDGITNNHSETLHLFSSLFLSKAIITTGFEECMFCAHNTRIKV